MQQYTLSLSLCRQLSRHLVGLWVTGNPTANALLHRVLVYTPLFLLSLSHCILFNPFDAMGICLIKQNFMYKVLVPSFITPYKLLLTYGGSGHIHVSMAG